MHGAFQCLESLFPAGQLLLDHVAGHAGEGWNEMCDWLAHAERLKSFYFTRPQVDVGKWQKIIPYLWVLLSTGDGLPERIGCHLHAGPPALPPEQRQPPEAAHVQKFSDTKTSMSCCTSNVNSLHRAPDGHEGKLMYLRQQFKQLRINFLGVQESRSPEFCSQVDQVLRMAGGGDGHQLGVELWVKSLTTICLSEWQTHPLST